MVSAQLVNSDAGPGRGLLPGAGGFRQRSRDKAGTLPSHRLDEIDFDLGGVDYLARHLGDAARTIKIERVLNAAQILQRLKQHVPQIRYGVFFAVPYPAVLLPVRIVHEFSFSVAR